MRVEVVERDPFGPVHVEQVDPVDPGAGRRLPAEGGRSLDDPVRDRCVERLVVVVAERGRADAQQRGDGRAVLNVQRGLAVELVHRRDLGPGAAPLGQSVDRDPRRRVRRRAGPVDVQRPVGDLRDHQADGAGERLEGELVLEHQAASLHAEAEVARRGERRGLLGGVEAHAGGGEVLPVHGEGPVLVAHRGRDARGGVAAEPGQHERGPARQVAVDRDLPGARLVRRGEVVAPARADQRQDEVRTRAAVCPHPGGAVVLEADPAVVARVGRDGSRRDGLRGAPQRSRRPTPPCPAGRA